MSHPFPSLIEAPMPILTKRLLIRPPQAGDGVALHRAISGNREHLGRFLPWALEPKSPEDHEDYARQQQAKFIQRSDIVLVFFDRQSGDLLGGSGLHRIDWTLPKFEIGYWIREDQEGCGLVTEAVNAITRYALQQFGAKRVEIRCETDNQRSRAVAERLGFHLDGVLRQERFKIGTQILTDTLVFSRLDAEGLPELDVAWS